jgi:hypothetical protein
MRRFIQGRIIYNLEATKRLLEQGEKKYDDICSGIYTYGIEEYGKILFLDNLKSSQPPNNNKLKVRYTHHDNGFLDHEHKFNLALKDKDLPPSCKVLRKGDFKRGDFKDGDYVMDTPADMKARMSVFYADFNKEDNYNSILKPEFGRDLLVKAVDDFLKFIKAQKYS